MLFAKDRSVGTRAERACCDTLLEPLVANRFAPVWAVYKAMPRAYPGRPRMRGECVGDAHGLTVRIARITVQN